MAHVLDDGITIQFTKTDLELLGIKPGDSLDFDADGGNIYIKKSEE